MFLDVFGQAINLADDFEANVVLVQFGGFGFEIMDKIFHQRIHFVFWTVPILDGEGVESQVFDAEFAGSANDDASGFRPGAVTFDPRQMALLCPTSVAVHNNGDVAWQ